MLDNAIQLLQEARPSSASLTNQELALLGFAILLYFLPAIVASIRDHVNVNSISVLNLFLGWTLLGWVISLVWAFTSQRRFRVDAEVEITRPRRRVERVAPERSRARL